MVDSPTAVKGQGESRRDTGRETALLIAVFPTDAKKVEKSVTKSSRTGGSAMKNTTIASDSQRPSLKLVFRITLATSLHPARQER